MTQPATITQLTPVLLVDEIEPCVAFWARVGFQTIAEVPHAGRLGFVMLGNGSATVMYQTPASVRDDLGASVADLRWLRDTVQQTHLFVTVGELAVVESALSDLPPVLPRRKTFYGATETGYLDPGGNVVVFAQFEREAPEDPGL